MGRAEVLKFKFLFKREASQENLLLECRKGLKNILKYELTFGSIEVIKTSSVSIIKQRKFLKFKVPQQIF